MPAPNVDAAGHFRARRAHDARSRRGGGRRDVRAVHEPSRRARDGRPSFARAGSERRWPVLVHGDESRDALLARFRDAGRAVLLGTASFWEGVDVPGDALRALLIAKLPFRVPTEPITAAHCEAITARGGDPFREYMLPHASLRLKQGFGRLDPHERRSRGRGHRRSACRNQELRPRTDRGIAAGQADRRTLGRPHRTDSRVLWPKWLAPNPSSLQSRACSQALISTLTHET